MHHYRGASHYYKKTHHMNYNARSIIVAFSFTTAKVQQKMRVCNSRMHFLTQSQENGAFFLRKVKFLH